MLRLPDAALRDYFSGAIDHKDAAVVARLVSVEIRAAHAGIHHGFDLPLGSPGGAKQREKERLTAELEAAREREAALVEQLANLCE